MRILLFGEFSGFMNCLKKGLQFNGHEVFLASNGDGFKNYPSDFRWDTNFGKKVGKLHSVFDVAFLWRHRSVLKDYDVVLLIEPNSLSRYTILNSPIYNYIIRKNKLIYLLGAGDTYRCYNFWYDSDTKYHEYYEGYRLSGTHGRYKNKARHKWEEKLLKRIDGYIPIWYEYAEPYRDIACCGQTIRIPIDISQFEYTPNVLHNGKVVFYHGVNRECKGTRFISAAFERLRKKYAGQAEFICAERLPFTEYMRLMSEANVIVDDANSFSIAMNGLFALQKGKLVMGGAEPIANRELAIPDDENPVFNINPDVDQICSVIEYIIENKDNIEAWGLKGRKFVEKYHDCRQISRQYIELWENDLNNYQSRYESKG